MEDKKKEVIKKPICSKKKIVLALTVLVLLGGSWVAYESKKKGDAYYDQMTPKQKELLEIKNEELKRTGWY